MGGQGARWAGAGEGLALSGDARSTEIVSCGENLRKLLGAAHPELWGPRRPDLLTVSRREQGHHSFVHSFRHTNAPGPVGAVAQLRTARVLSPLRGPTYTREMSPQGEDKAGVGAAADPAQRALKMTSSLWRLSNAGLCSAGTSRGVGHRGRVAARLARLRSPPTWCTRDQEVQEGVVAAVCVRVTGQT